MEELKALVRKLENEYGEKEQIKILQEIGEKLLLNYVIEIGGNVIEPLVVEAYYFNKKSFPDCNTHMSPEQQEFNVLYRHSKKKDLKPGRTGGADICLACNNGNGEKYYLSFLIKNSLFNGEFCKQAVLNVKLNQIVDIDIIPASLSLRKTPLSSNSKVAFNRRSGLAQSCYKDALLAVCLINEKTCEYDLTLESEKVSRAKQWRYAFYSVANNEPKEKADKRNGSKIENIYWDLAKEDLERKN